MTRKMHKREQEKEWTSKKIEILERRRKRRRRRRSSERTGFGVNGALTLIHRFDQRLFTIPTKFSTIVLAVACMSLAPPHYSIARPESGNNSQNLPFHLDGVNH